MFLSVSEEAIASKPIVVLKTKEEREKFIRKLYQSGYKLEDLKEYVSERTLDSYLEPIKREEREKKLVLKKQCLALLSEGRSHSDVSRITGVPRQTITDWASGKKLKNNGNGGLPQSATEWSAAGQDSNILLKNNNTATAHQSTAPYLSIRPIRPFSAGKRKPAQHIHTPAIDAVINLSYRLEKFEIRRWIIEQSIALLDKISAVTFPGSEWLMERDLLCLGDLVEKIVGLEKGRDMYAFSKHNVPFLSEKVEFLNKNDGDFFSEAKPRRMPVFNLLWLDYMGPFSFNRLDVFKTAIENGYVDETALLCLTFLKGRDGKLNPWYEQYTEKDAPPVGEGRYNNARLAAVSKEYCKTAEGFGYNTIVLDAHQYCERQGGVAKSPMYFIAMLISRKSRVVRKVAQGINGIIRKCISERNAEVLRLISQGVNTTDDLLPLLRCSKNALICRIRRLIKAALVKSIAKNGRSPKYSLTSKGIAALRSVPRGNK